MDQAAVLARLVTLQASIPKAQGLGSAHAAIADMIDQLSVVEQPYNYVFDSNTVAGTAGLTTGATITGQVQIDSNAPFLLQQTMYFAAAAGATSAAQTAATQIVPNVLVQLSDATGGVIYTANSVPLDNIFGSGKLPFIWQVPMVMRPKMTLQIQLQSFEAAVALRLFLVFSGKKLYSATD